ncbi:MAG: hypothetical protein H8E48_08665 [Chloroflexi bacterium]|nr:hypothetical protein [Chloroflexota bacterium]
MILFVIIFVGFLSYLILNNFSDKLLSADFYTKTLAAEDTYNRIYDDVLLDDELTETTERFLGDIEIVSHEEIVDLLREIMPPEYIQSEVEGAIGRTVDYINEDVDELDLYIDLNLPLNNVKPVMLGYIDGRIDELEVEDPGFSGCSTDAAQRLADSFSTRFNQIADGVVPETVPSLQAIDAPCRVIIFELAYGTLIDGAGLPEATATILKNGKGDLRLPFAQGDTLEVLKVSARLLAEPLMDVAIEGVREDLTDTGQFDLIRQMAEWNDDTTEAQIRADLADGRDWISKASNFGDLASLIMVIGGAAAMGLLFFPTLGGMLRWPGIALLVTGGFFFVVGKIAQSKVPDALADAVETGADKVSNVPPAVTDLGTDVLVSFGAQLTDGFVGPSITMLTFGIILLGASFFSFILKRFIPFLK